MHTEMRGEISKLYLLFTTCFRNLSRTSFLLLQDYFYNQSKMFCADYIASFIFHGLISGGLLESSHRRYFGTELSPQKTASILGSPGVPVLTGSLAGALKTSLHLPFSPQLAFQDSLELLLSFLLIS